ncbi:Alpha/beta hydrolase fold-1 [Aspergillus similis]
MSPQDNRPIVIFAPGAWNAGSIYDDFRELLSRRGILSVAVDHPSNGAEPPTKGLGDDVQHLRQVLTDYANQGKRIVLVGHSYGGMVISGAAASMGFEQRAEAGKPGGVILLVYMAAFVVSNGKSLKDIIGGQLLPWMLVENSYIRLDPTANLLPDIPKEMQAKLAKDMHPHISFPAFLETATEEPWHTIPSVYIVCDNDQALPPAVQDSMIELLPNPRVFRLPSGHTHFLSLPNQTADILEVLVPN